MVPVYAFRNRTKQPGLIRLGGSPLIIWVEPCCFVRRVSVRRELLFDMRVESD
jgi:hypothetical protein